MKPIGKEKIEKLEHILDKDECWCKPFLREIKGDNYWFHKDKKGGTALKVLKTN